MKTKQSDEANFKHLRRRAESQIIRKPMKKTQPSEHDIQKLIHELEVHQVELEMQNEELRAAQQELAASRDRYFELYDLAPVGYLTLDRRGRIHEANLAAAKLLGGNPARFVGRLLSSFLEQSHADNLYRHLRDVFETGAKSGCELVIGSREQGEGRETAVRIDSMSCDVPSGEQRCRSVLIDISDLRDAQEARRSEEARFRDIAEVIEDVFYIMDSNHNILYLSPAYDRLWGHSGRDLIRRRAQWLEDVHPDDKTRVQSAHDAAMRGEPFDEQYRIVRPDEQVRWVRDRTFSVETPEGHTERYIGIAQDISKAKELEEELRQIQKIEAVGALATGVAHDFGNVLQAVLGCVNLAQREGITREATLEYLARAAAAARRGGKLAEQLMTFARRKLTKPEPVELDAVIKGSARLIECLVTEQILVKVHTNARGAQILADAVQFEQILMNLAANARDAMPEGGTLFIRTEVVEADDLGGHFSGLERAGSYVRLVIADMGAGMDETTRRRIFEPFFTTKEVGKGTGLGLSTVFAVTKKLGAHISVRSELGQGTTFAFLFPICNRISESSRPRVYQELRFAGTVLLVEDDPTIRTTLCHKLEELGLEVLEAEDPNEALIVCEEHQGELDLLISDVILPVMPGTRLAERIRELYPKMHVLLMSASHGVLYDNEINLGEHLTLQKPFGREELSEQLAKLLPSQRVERASLPPSTS